MKTIFPPSRTLLPALLASVLGCGSGSGAPPDGGMSTADLAAADLTTASAGDGGACKVNAASPAKYVRIGFWKTADCSGDPISTNNFPVDGNAPCYCWPGHSGENSANGFKCDRANNSFTYTQYVSLTCSGNPTVKTSYTTKCLQDVPPTLYAKVLDLTACP